MAGHRIAARRSPPDSSRIMDEVHGSAPADAGDGSRLSSSPRSSPADDSVRRGRRLGLTLGRRTSSATAIAPSAGHSRRFRATIGPCEEPRRRGRSRRRARNRLRPAAARSSRCSSGATTPRRRSCSSGPTALEPAKGSILEALGRAYFNSGQPERARATFEALLELDPSSHYAPLRARPEPRSGSGRTRARRANRTSRLAPCALESPASPGSYAGALARPAAPASDVGRTPDRGRQRTGRPALDAWSAALARVVSRASQSSPTSDLASRISPRSAAATASRPGHPLEHQALVLVGPEAVAHRPAAGPWRGTGASAPSVKPGAV